MYQRKLDELQARLRELESAHKNSEGKKQEKKEEQVPQTPKVPYFFFFFLFFEFLYLYSYLCAIIIVADRLAGVRSGGPVRGARAGGRGSRVPAGEGRREEGGDPDRGRVEGLRVDRRG